MDDFLSYKPPAIEDFPVALTPLRVLQELRCVRSEAAVVAVKLEATEVAIEIDDKNACDSHVIIFDRSGLIGLALHLSPGASNTKFVGLHHQGKSLHGGAAGCVAAESESVASLRVVTHVPIALQGGSLHFCHSQLICRIEQNPVNVCNLKCIRM